jgi:hypothetical protein
MYNNRYYGGYGMPQAYNDPFGSLNATAPAPDILWVQGEAGAKSYPVAPGHSAILMDSEGSVFYIKTLDTSGVPLPLRAFTYVEKNAGPTPANQAASSDNDYITRKEFEAALAKLGGENNA